MALRKLSIGSWMICVLVLTTILAVSCEKLNSTTTQKSTTVKEEDDDDDDFDFSVFDKSPEERKKESDGKLGDSIARAFRSFTRENNINIGSLLANGGLASLFGFSSRSKRRIPETKLERANTNSNQSIETIDNAGEIGIQNSNFETEQMNPNELSDAESDTEKYEELLSFDSFSDDSDDIITPVKSSDGDYFKKLPESTTHSNIHKIPKRIPILTRRTKSLNDSKEGMNDAEMDDVLSGDILKNVTGIEKFLEVYSAQRLLESWRDIRTAVAPTCRHQLGEYLVGLTKQKLWALKMDDASGHYSSGYFWGNAYWAGSADLCNHIASLENDSSKAAPVKRNGGFSQADGQPGPVMMKSIMSKPPFLPAFYMARLQLNETTSPEGPRIIHLGVCLPANCSAEDVRALLTASHSSISRTVLAVRAPHLNYYNMLEDITFQILAGVSALVLGLMIAGSLYELALGPRLQQTAHAPTPTPPAPALPTKMDGIPKVKMTNGISVYSLNNSITNNNNNSEERLNIDMPSTEGATQLNIFSELILSFSVISNMRTICDQTVGSDTIPSIHGLRSLSMAWVILGHTCIVAFKYSDNAELRKEVEKEFLFQTVTNGAFSVDTFFCISGILVSYIYFRTNAKGSLERLTKGTKGFVSGVLQFLGLLGYRFARLTAPYMFMLGVVEVSMKWFHYNSVFDPPTQDHVNCPNYWWRNMLYINTLFPVEQMCMLWSWYLADDSQFYVVGAIILILAASHFKTAAGALGLFLMSSWLTTGYIAWSNNHMPSTDDPLALFDKIYAKPWTRLGPYLVGMAAGWLLFKTNCRIRMSKITVAAGWLASTLILLYLVYGLYNTQLSPLAAAAYSSLSHTGWAISVAWIVVACSTGYGGYINTLLSATVLYPFSRVTYCAYLVHPVVIRYLAMHMDHPFHLGKSMMAIIFLGQMVASFMLSFVISLAFEAPVVTMLKILAPNRRKKIQ